MNAPQQGAVDVLSTYDELVEELKSAANYTGESCWWWRGEDEDEDLLANAAQARAAVVEVYAQRDELVGLLKKAGQLISDQGEFIEQYRTSGTCPHELARDAVDLLHRRAGLLPNHYDKQGRIGAALARCGGAK